MKNAHIVGALAMAVAFSGPATAVQHANMDRGFSAEKAYQTAEIDSINAFNGNLSITLPLLQPVPVNSNLAFGLNLVYNSNIWNYRPVPCLPNYCTLATPNAVPNPDSILENVHANAGMGWMVVNGLLYSPDSPGSSTTYYHQYIAPDGSEHLLYATLHDGETPTTNVFYSRDSSYLRLKIVSNLATVEFPDGTKQTFQDRDAPHHRWRLYQVLDPYGNTVSVQTVFWPGTWVDQSWTITDSASAGRTQLVSFRSDGNVSTVQLAAFGSTTATHTFSYTTANIPRASKHNDPSTSQRVDVVLLSSVTLTGAGGSTLQTWSFPTYDLSQQLGLSPAERYGALQKVVYPTGGTLEWTYGTYRLVDLSEDHDCEDRYCEADHETMTTTGVATKKVTVGTVIGQWTYTTDKHYKWVNQFTRVIDETITKVTSPQLDDTVWHFTTDDFSNEGDLGYGLPFTRNQTDGSGHYLSLESFSGAATVSCLESLPGCQSTGALKRAQYVRYDYDYSAGGGIKEGYADMNNRRAVSRRTAYVDDSNCGTPAGNCTSGEDFYNFDGVGHHRVVVTRGNFGLGDVRREKTDFNPASGAYKVLADWSGYDYSADPDPFNDSPAHSFSPWSASAPWILGTYDYTTQTEGSTTARQTFCFDGTTGFLRATRALKLANPGDADLLAVFTPDSVGNVDTEQYLGGDTQSGALPTTYCQPGTNPRWTTVAGDQYRLKHTYQYGSRRTSRYADGTGTPLGFFVLDLDNDANTGLAAASRDTAGLRSDLTYDGLGRLTWSKPQSGHGAWVHHQYLPNGTCGGPAKVETCAKTNGTSTECVDVASSCSPLADSLTRSALHFDGLGRLYGEFTKYTSSLWNQRLTEYDSTGRKVSVSEWQANGTSGGSIRKTIYNYCGDHDWNPGTPTVCDPFDRILSVTPPDGTAHNIAMRYTGVRVVERKLQVATAIGSETDATTTETYDRQRRLAKVTEQSGTAGANVDTLYTYDVGNRLKQASTTSGATQNRIFTYDLRGLLTTAQLPEVGTGGNGTITYSKLDARGHTRRIQDGQHDVAFTFDRAERLTQAAQADASGNSGTPVVKTLEYDTIGGVQQGFSLGKLVRATMNNYPEGSTNYPVVESYTYSGVGGRTSARTTTVDGRTINQGFTWSDLGLPATVVYPDDTGITGDPARTITPSYTLGFLTAVPSYATSISYHPNLMVNQVVHANGVTVTYAKDDNDMRRPKSIATSQATPANWLTGNYAFDGAGNIKQIGTTAPYDSFQYDKVNRLTSGTIATGGVNRTQTASFDAFGFMTNLTTNGGGQGFTQVSGTNHISGSTYDGAGSMLTWGAYSYLWDRLNQATKAYGSGMTARWFLYTADGERIEERIGSLASPNTTVLASRGLDGKVLRLFTYSSGTWSWTKDYVYRDELSLASVEPPTGSPVVKHFHLDHLGTIRRITSASKAVIGTHDYYPFGLEATDPSQDGERMRFTGHERDNQGTPTVQTDDLDYMHARYHNPNIARFLAIDQGTARPPTPQSWNRYIYAVGNPVRLIDPRGKVGVESFYTVLLPLAVRTADFVVGFGQGTVSAATGGKGMPGMEPATSTGLERDSARALGQRTAGFVATHDVVVEASLSYKILTAGVCSINSTDNYFFFGATRAESALSRLMPLSASVFVGLIQNYSGKGSYSGMFGTVTTSAPIGWTVSANPSNPRAPQAFGVTISLDLGLASRSVAIYGQNLAQFLWFALEANKEPDQEPDHGK